MELLATNHKLSKPVPGWRITGLSLLPGDSAGRGELCPERGQCFAVCLAWAGMGQFDSVRKARRDRTHLLFDDPAGFAAMLDSELLRATVRAISAGRKLAVRLNVLSDIDWRDHPLVYSVIRRHARGGVVFYDYTKRTGKPDAAIYGKPARVCYSWSERSERVPTWAKWTAVVGDLEHPALRWRSASTHWPIVDGDADDLFFLRPQGIQLLAPKGLARREGAAAGFVMRGTSE